MNIIETKQCIKEFIEGKTTIFAFKEKCDNDSAIYDFLQEIVDEKKRKKESFDRYPFYISEDYTLYSSECLDYFLEPDSDPSLQYGSPRRYDSVKQCLNFNWRSFTHNLKSASGALTFFNEVLVMYYQIDKDVNPTRYYGEEYKFVLDVIPEYLSGEPELYIQENIIALFPSTMKKTERKKAIKAKIKEEFKSLKGYPCWYQSSEWPLGKDGKPATYIGKGKSKGSVGSWLFKDESTDEIITIEQYD